jgi:hypothetical protein
MLRALVTKAGKKRVRWVCGIVKEISDEVTRTASEHALIELQSTCGIFEGVVKWDYLELKK